MSNISEWLLGLLFTNNDSKPRKDNIIKKKKKLLQYLSDTDGCFLKKFNMPSCW